MAGGEVHLSGGIDASDAADASNVMKERIQVAAPGPRVGDVMSRPAKTLRRNDRLKIADELMNAESIRHLPVLDERGTIVGILSQRDIFRSALLHALGYGARARDKALEWVLVKEVMIEPVATTTPGTSIPDAARQMCERKIGYLPVVDQGALVGILTESDLVRRIAERGDPEDGPTVGE